MHEAILIQGAGENNLQQVTLAIPRNKLVVLTGVSGSGKSSLAFDTLFAEGQRRYVESLSSNARQLLGQMQRPKVDSIRGLTPTIAIGQRRAAANPRSTVGTVTEIHDYLRLLWARVGIQHCHACGRVVDAQSAAEISAEVAALPERTKFLLLAPILRGEQGSHQAALEGARRDGFVRVRVDGEVLELAAVAELDEGAEHDIELVVDRLVSKPGAEARISGSVETALRAGEGEMQLLLVESGEVRRYSEKRVCPECCLEYPALVPAGFSFNSPKGMCPECQGLGQQTQLDENLMVPDRALTIHQGAMGPWSDECQQREGRIYDWVAAAAKRLGVDLDGPWEEQPAAARRRFLEGADAFVELLEDGGGLGDRMSRLPCLTCGGTRLAPGPRSVSVGGLLIDEVCRLTVEEALGRFSALQLTGSAAQIATEPLREIRNRLGLLGELGLTYLTLDRAAATLSGGELQRIQLGGQLGSQLSGVTYVLDEPSVGLHPRDTDQLIGMLCRLRDLGNTVVVVEHDESVIRAADHVFDFGPGAGLKGGRILYAGPPDGLADAPDCLTGEYLAGRRSVMELSGHRGASPRQLVVRGACCHNLAEIDVAFPLERFVVVSGVSGAGKSSLVTDLLVPALSQALHGARVRPGDHQRIDGVEHLDRVILVDQRPLGRSPRSNPATYSKVYAEIRQLFAEQKESRIHGFDAGRFSFNRKGGRCEACQGQGQVRIEMHFLPDVFTRCEVCVGQRFNVSTLRVRYRGYSVADILALPVGEVLVLLGRHPKIAARLQALCDVGLDYLALGQPAPTLSGGEAQRVKLARELARSHRGRTLYVLDEPTTGLHFDDVARLMGVLQRLVDAGNSVLLVEHNLDVIRQADHLIDLGPEGGAGGGYVVACGTPEEVARVAESHTGRYLSVSAGSC